MPSKDLDRERKVTAHGCESNGVPEKVDENPFNLLPCPRREKGESLGYGVLVESVFRSDGACANQR